MIEGEGMVRLSKSAKARLKRKTSGEAKKIANAARLLADEGVISHGRYMAVERTVFGPGRRR